MTKVAVYLVFLKWSTEQLALIEVDNLREALPQLRELSRRKVRHSDLHCLPSPCVIYKRLTANEELNITKGKPNPSLPMGKTQSVTAPNLLPLTMSFQTRRNEHQIHEVNIRISTNTVLESKTQHPGSQPLNFFGARELLIMKVPLSDIGLALFMFEEVRAHLYQCCCCFGMITFLISSKI